MKMIISGSRTATALFVACLASLSCGSSGGGTSVGGTSSGLPRSSTLGSLTTAQDDTLCDWVNAKQGGYGRTVTCSDGSQQTTDHTQASCADGFPSLGAGCPALTVGDVEDCTNAIGTNICNFTTDPACASLAACLQ